MNFAMHPLFVTGLCLVAFALGYVVRMLREK
jgi:hypothetical protein